MFIPPSDGGVPERTWCIELLLRRFIGSACGSVRFLEKKEAFEAVIGVLGVLVLTLRGGGVIMPSDGIGSGNAAILEAVGVLKGKRFNGGSRSGCKLFFLTWVVFRISDSTGATAFLVLGSGSWRIGSRTDPRPERLLVEMLLILLASKGLLTFRWVKNGGSAGESLGDSYAFGIAGTGGTSISSSFPAELCIRGFGVGNREEFCGGGN